MLAAPEHPYTRALLEAVPTTHEARVAPAPLVAGDTLDPHDQPSCCPFHPRCQEGPRVRPERTMCAEDDPRDGSEERVHRTVCHFAPTAAPGAHVIA